MIDVGELFEKAINNWRANKGIGTAIIPPPLNDKLMILGVLQRIYAKSPNVKVVIITNSFSERQSIIDFITQQEDLKENNAEFKELIDSGKLKVFTDIYWLNNEHHTLPFLCIWYRPVNICQELLHYVSKCKFKLIVLDKIPSQSNALFDIYKIAPLLPDFQQAEVQQLRLSLPVEEMQIGIDIPADTKDSELLKCYNEYITTSISIFGSFDIMQQANVGNAKLNISSTQICYQIAQENGWHEHLDMNIGFNLELDSLYNPNSLRERASTTYEIIRERGKLLSDFQGKLDVILDIVRENADKKILIINKRGEFANAVTEFLNKYFDTDICGNYHDKVNNIPAVTVHDDPIYYKTGSRKGERKMMGAKAQKSLNMERFNKDYLNVLSTNSAPDKDLAIDVDIIIITSPMCNDIKSYIYRLSKLYFKSNSIKLYSLYCKNTLEQKLIEKKDFLENHSVKSASSNNDAFSDFIVSD